MKQRLAAYWIDEIDPPETLGHAFELCDHVKDADIALSKSLDAVSKRLRRDANFGTVPCPLVLLVDAHQAPSGLRTPLAHVDAVVELGIDPGFEVLGSKVNTLAERLTPRLLAAAERSDHMLALVIAYLRDNPITPAMNPNRKSVVDYPRLHAIHEPGAVLSSLAESGHLSARAVERIPQCPSCGGGRTLAREICANCMSSVLAEGHLVHHYRCGYQGPERDFISKDEDGLRCPKCAMRLAHYGRDHDRSGLLFHCDSCGQDMSEPDVGFLCLDCGSSTKGDDIETRDAYEYELSLESRVAISMLAKGDTESGLDHLLQPSRPRKIHRIQSSVAERFDASVIEYSITLRFPEGFSRADKERTYGDIAGALKSNSRDTDTVKVVKNDEMELSVKGSILASVGSETEVIEKLKKRMSDVLVDGIGVDVAVNDTSTENGDGIKP